MGFNFELAAEHKARQERRTRWICTPGWHVVKIVRYRRSEEVAWPMVAAILTIARFREPASELHIEDTGYRRTALDDLLGVAVENIHTDRLHAGLDQLLPHQEAIEKHLRQRLGDLFDLQYDLLLYDITSTYFEGECAANPHILVCFLAYVPWKTLAQWMRRGGLGDAPRTLLEEFAKIKSGDVVLPARMPDGAWRTIHLRCVTTPDAAQKVLLSRLGLTLPQGLRGIDEVRANVVTTFALNPPQRHRRSGFCSKTP